MKKLAVIALLSFCALSAAPRRSEALIIGATVAGPLSPFVFVAGGLTIGLGMLSDALGALTDGASSAVSGSRTSHHDDNSSWAIYTVGFLLDGDSKVAGARDLPAERDLAEQVRLGIYTPAEAALIDRELKGLDQGEAKKEAKVDTQGRSSADMLKDMGQQLGVSELTAGFILSEMGVQTE